MLQIEFYMNYVFKLAHPSVSKKEFAFEGMIARLPNKLHKSMTVMQQILNIGHYGNVYVIDDLFEGRQTVWKKTIPSNLLRHGVRFHAFDIEAFVIRANVWSPSQNKAAQVIGRCLESRSTDNQLKYLNISQKMQMRLQGN